ncbi:MAG: carbohydate-binding domain-containing protein [Candidatus Marinimicrobia bacterium]|nr:carbohydate-binding domain-containing protein [Candidatus Neomarinimicrobiota bacterium]
MKIWKTMFMLIAMVALMISCDKDPGQIEVSWQLVENQYKGRNQHKSEVTFMNNSRYTLKNDNWECYFSWFRSVTDEQESKIIDGETINGDYSKLYPTELFEDLKPGESITFPLIGTHYALNETDAITGCYFVIQQALGKEVIISSGKTEVLPFPENDKLKRASYDHLEVQNAQIRYKENENVKMMDNKDLSPIFPTPNKITLKGDTFALSKNMEIYYYKDLASEASYLQERMNFIFNAKIYRYKFRSKSYQKFSDNYIVLNITDGEPGSYRLEIDPDVGIVIYGADAAGVFYGIQSLFSLFPPDLNKEPERIVNVPRLIVEDAPRFPYRGIHLDVSRSFHGKKEVLHFMELISNYKLNKLHFHITDDEGWRVEIRPIPELTEIGAFRGHTKDHRDHLQPTLGSGPYADPEVGNGSGYYSREDFIEILRFARKHHIEVIPEIDMPGHIRSAVKAMEARYYNYMEENKPDSALMYLLTDFEDTTYYTSAQRYHDNTANPCMESTYRFVQVVIDELVAMYKEAGAPLTTLHIGGDELPRGAFVYSPICQAFLDSQDEYKSVNELHKYFTKRVSAMLREHNVRTAGWEEVACMHEDGHLVPNPTLLEDSITAYIWNNVWGWGAEDLGYKLANTGFPVVLLSANNYYFDFAYNRDPYEPGLYWGGYTDTRSAWEFTPYDITKCAEVTLYGDSISEEMFEGKTRLTEAGKENVLGLSATLWGETTRTWDRVEYMAFPKILGLAERAWSAQPDWASIEDKNVRSVLREADWNHFANKVGQVELAHLDQYNVNYRIPLPGAIIEDDTLKANIRFPGLDLRYTLDGSEPTVNSQKYILPVVLSTGDKVKIAAFNKRGRSSRVVVLP